MKGYALGFCLAVFSATVSAQQANPCAALSGAALDRCQVNQQQLQQQQLQQQQLTQQQQQLTQLQQQLAQQQQQIAQQQEQLRQQQSQFVQQQQLIAQQQELSHKNEMLGEQLAQEKASHQPAARAAMEYSKRAEVKSWKADNTWYGSDYTRTQFAMRYAKQLQQEQPDLLGRPFLDAISAKVRDTFGAGK